MEPTDLHALNDLGFLLCDERGDVAGAEACYREVLGVDSGSPAALVNLTVLLSQERERGGMRLRRRVKLSGLTNLKRRLSKRHNTCQLQSTAQSSSSSPTAPRQPPSLAPGICCKMLGAQRRQASSLPGVRLRLTAPPSSRGEEERERERE